MSAARGRRSCAELHLVLHRLLGGSGPGELFVGCGEGLSSVGSLPIADRSPTEPRAFLPALLARDAPAELSSMQTGFRPCNGPYPPKSLP